MTGHNAARLSPEAIIGVLLVAAGGAMLLDRLDILHSVARLWPVAIIGAGIALLLGQFDNPPRN